MENMTVTMPLEDFEFLKARNEKLKEFELTLLTTFDSDEGLQMFAIGFQLLLEMFRKNKQATDDPEVHAKRDKEFQEILERVYGGKVKAKLDLIRHARPEVWNESLAFARTIVL